MVAVVGREVRLLNHIQPSQWSFAVGSRRFCRLGLLATHSFGRAGEIGGIASVDPTVDPAIKTLTWPPDERDLQLLRQCVAVAPEVLFHPSFKPFMRVDCR